MPAVIMYDVYEGPKTNDKTITPLNHLYNIGQ